MKQDLKNIIDNNLLNEILNRCFTIFLESLLQIFCIMRSN